MRAQNKEEKSFLWISSALNRLGVLREEVRRGRMCLHALSIYYHEVPAPTGLPKCYHNAKWCIIQIRDRERDVIGKETCANVLFQEWQKNPICSLRPWCHMDIRWQILGMMSTGSEWCDASQKGHCTMHRKQHKIYEQGGFHNFHLSPPNVKSLGKG